MQPVQFHGDTRNTPTHVGKTHGGVPRQEHEKKHPHARGEDSSPASGLPQRRETPPRTWGRLFRAFSPKFSKRNTPTHVGKTFGLSFSFLHFWKHPHARGEDYLTASISSVLMEAPPRTWGRRDDFISRMISARNTPTHVGKTRCIWPRHVA